MTPSPSRGALTGVRVLDLSRILAGPTATQLLGDLGADVIKVERPGRGDDTRAWGPPFVENANGSQGVSSYFSCANRNKRSIAIDLAQAEGVALVKRLAAHSDVLVENYKVGDLARRGLGYEDLRQTHPRLVYCSITGFGQTGPRAAQTGYDILAQAMGGIMSLTGEASGPPSKVGVGIADVMCGMYACVAILAALRHRDHSGEGQHIDLALFDAQLAWLINEGTNYLVSGEVPKRRGTGHPNIVPYQLFDTADGHIVVACGNDDQFRKLSAEAGCPELADDPRFAKNADRVRNRAALLALLTPLFAARKSDSWERGLTERGVPAGEVKEVDRALADPQALHRQMRVRIEDARAKSGSVELLANPLKLSASPVQYRRPPPPLGADGDDVLAELLQVSAEEITGLRARGVVG